MNITALEKGDKIEFSTRTLQDAGYRLHVFPQYTYLRDRIDAFRNNDTNVFQKHCVIVTGTPGIGKAFYLLSPSDITSR